MNDWEALFLARHHGLPVRLLDWTSNPLVALYYAALCENTPEKDGAVWAIRRVEKIKDEINVLNEARSPLDFTGVKFIYPIFNSPRLVAHSGFFTLHGNPSLSLEDDDPLKHKEYEFDIQVLRKWKISKNKKADMLVELERLAINNRTLFPDLDGLAKGLWQLEIIRKFK